MNIKTQCCGLAILIVILYFYFYHKKVNMKTERAFFGFLMAVFTTVCLDIISIWGIVHVDIITPVIREILCKLYVVSVMTAVYTALIYVCVDIYTETRIFKRIRVAFGTILVVSAVCILALPIEYVYNPEEGLVYTAGASVYVGYVLGLIFLFALIYHIIFKSKKMKRRRRNAIAVWLVIWIIATVLQISIKGLLLFSFAAALGIVIVYLFLENPEMNLDRNTGVFNQIALLQYVPQLYNEGRKFAALELVVESGMDSAAQEISELLLTVKEAQSFRYSTNNVMMLFEYGSDALKVKEYINDRFEKGFGEDHNNIMRPYWYYMPDSSVVRTSKDFLNVIKFAHHNVLDKTNTDITVIDQTMADNMYRRERITKLLEQAIKEDKIEVFYQPIYSTVEKRFLSAEALVRIRDENEEIILPGRFIDIAEKNGMILKLSEMVFEKVCRFVSDPKFEMLGLKHIEINLSIAQCVQRSLAADYIFVMNKYNVDPSRINL
ncbi:MAG: EAL domain-containing protein, partial [Lachnospiraceae bacterium]|nr:EAL domain-containing protein [Lachnospiraceae bacterium]